MSGVLVYSERKPLTLELLTFAATLGQSTAVVLLGPDAATWAGDCFAHGAAQAYAGDGVALAGLPCDVVSAALAQIVEQAGADVILIGSTLRGREVAGRLAQKLGAGCITDANGLRIKDGRIVANRYALGGSTIATQMIPSGRQVVAVMPQTVEAAPSGAGGGGGGAGASGGFATSRKPWRSSRWACRPSLA